MENTIKVLEYFKAGLSDIEASIGERQPMQDEIELALIECKNNGALGDVSGIISNLELKFHSLFLKESPDMLLFEFKQRDDIKEIISVIEFLKKNYR